MTTHKHSLPLALVLMLLTIPLHDVSGQTISISFERDRGRTILSTIKSDLKKHYYDPTFRGLDIDARFKLAEEKIKAATTQNEIFAIIAQALLDFDDSHTYFVPPDRPYSVEYGWKMQMIRDKCYVVAVKPGSDAEAKGLKEGDEIHSIDGIGPTRQNFWKILYLYQSLNPRAGASLVVIKPDGREQQFDVMAKLTHRKRIMDLDSSEIFDLIRRQENEERLHRHRYYETDEFLIWKMPAFDIDEAKVDDVVGRAKKRKTLILDLRGNGGGYEKTLLRMVSNFFDKDIKIGEIKRRKQTKTLLAKSRGGQTFTGKLVVLIDSGSGSAAELLARVVQLEKRGTVIGDASSGAVMRSRLYGHRHGLGVFMFYGVSITDADIMMSDGHSLERIGVTPDEVKLPTASDLAAKLDPVLSYAASLAGITLPPDKAGALFPIEWRK